MSVKEKEKKTGPPLIEYLATPEIANIISKGMSILYEKQPRNPVEYLALWLLNQSNEKLIKQKVCRGVIDSISLKIRRRTLNNYKKNTSTKKSEEPMRYRSA